MGRLLLVAAIVFLPALRCTVDHWLEFENIPIAPPTAAQLDEAQRDFEGGETWRGDPKRVAHRTFLEYLDVPWKYQPYRAEAYRFRADQPEWGPSVVRGLISGRQNLRYRVKIRKHRDIWYPIQVNHAVDVVLPHPVFQEEPRQ